jgi:hypothetical protein
MHGVNFGDVSTVIGLLIGLAASVAMITGFNVIGRRLSTLQVHDRQPAGLAHDLEELRKLLRRDAIIINMVYFAAGSLVTFLITVGVS